MYTEKHTAFYQDSKLLRSTNDYFDLSGKRIAELNSDYTKRLVMPTYVFQDFRTGSQEGAGIGYVLSTYSITVIPTGDNNKGEPIWFVELYE